VPAAPLPSDTIDVSLGNNKVLDAKIGNVQVADLDTLDGRLLGLKARDDRLADVKVGDGRIAKVKTRNDKLLDIDVGSGHNAKTNGKNDGLEKLDVGNDPLLHLKARSDKLADVKVVIWKRCVDCTSKDAAALDLVVDASAKHHSKIVQVRLDNLLRDIKAVKVTSGKKNLPKEKAALTTLIVKTKIDKAKKDCSSESLAPITKAIVTSDASLDILWSKKEEAEKKVVELDAKVTGVVLEREYRCRAVFQGLYREDDEH